MNLIEKIMYSSPIVPITVGLFTLYQINTSRALAQENIKQLESQSISQYNMPSDTILFQRVLRRNSDIHTYTFKEGYGGNELKASYFILNSGYPQVFSIERGDEILAQDRDGDGEFDFATYNNQQISLDKNKYVSNKDLENETNFDEFRKIVAINKRRVEATIYVQLNHKENPSKNIIQLYEKAKKENKQLAPPIPNIPNLDMC